MKKGLLCLLLILTGAVTYGQTVRELKKRLVAAQHDTTQLRLYCELAALSSNNGRRDDAFFYIQKGLALLIKNPSKYYEGWLRLQLAQYYRNKGKHSEALTNVRMACRLFQQSGEQNLRLRAFYELTGIYADQGDYEASIKQSFNNLRYFEQLKRADFVGHTYLMLATVYGYLNMPDQEMSYANKFFQLVQKTSDPETLFIAYMAKADIYQARKAYRQAWPYRKKALQLARVLDRKQIFLVRELDMAAANLRELHRPLEAVRCSKEALQLPNTYYNASALAETWQELALDYLALNRFQEAVQATNRALPLAEQSKRPYVLLQVLKTLATVQEKTGNYQASLLTFKKRESLKDSLTTIEKTQRIAQLQASYDLKQKDQTILLLHKNAQIQQLRVKKKHEELVFEQRHKFLLVMGITALSVLLGGVIHLLLKSMRLRDLLIRQKVEIEQQATHLKESNVLKDNLFSIVAHDLRAPVASLKATFLLSRKRITWSREMDKLEEQVDGLQHTLDNVLYWALNQRNGLQAKLYKTELSDVITDVLASFDGVIRYKELIVTANLPKLYICTDEMLTLLVLRNIIHNAIKFTPVGGAIHLCIRQTATAINLSVIDTGIGMDVSKIAQNQSKSNRGTGLGLPLAEALMNRIGGNLAIKSEVGQGTTITLSWPVEVGAAASLSAVG